MKSYIQDLVGDEDAVVIDCAILQSSLTDAIYKRLLYSNTTSMKEVEDVIKSYVLPYTVPYVSYSVKVGLE